MDVDTIIIGAGLAGICAAERLAREKNERVLIVEQRGHIGGNCHDGYDGNGILVHTYGPHIFHTDSVTVWEYLSRFTEWHEYRHNVVGSVDGLIVPIPFNLNTLHALLPGPRGERIEEKLLASFGPGGKVPVLELSRSGDEDLRFLAQFVLEKIFLKYSRKQWGLEVDQLDPEVLGRVPISVSRDDGYFQDRYQGLPEQGYTAMFERMLDSPLIEILLDTPMAELVRCDPASGEIFFRGRPFAGRVIATGMIDELFGFPFGELPYRALRFAPEQLDVERFQQSAVVNFPNEHEFTRTTEFKHMTGQVHPRTTIMREFPSDFVRENARGEGQEGRRGDGQWAPEAPAIEANGFGDRSLRLRRWEKEGEEGSREERREGRDESTIHGATNQRMTISRITNNESPNPRITNTRITNNEYPNTGLSEAVPCYPILHEESKRAAARYLELAGRVPRLTAVGRLAEFRYYDMDDLVERVLGLRL
jgi:UDP-galactopyranose mutase